MTMPRHADLTDAGTRLRRFILLLFVTGTIVTGIDLILLGHVEEFRQWVPLTVLPASLAALVWHRLDRARRSTRVLQGTMVVCIACGAAGLWFHYTGNAEFELEMYPSLGGWALVREALSGATPALAPLAMIQIGLLGLVYTYRHPFLDSASPRAGAPETTVE